MANANVSILNTANNTFQDWLINTNTLANLINGLLNGLFYADNGSLTIANGSILISGGPATLLSVSGNSTISQQLTVGSILDTGSITVQGGAALFTNANVLVSIANVAQTKTLIANTQLTAANSNTVNLNVSTQAVIALANVSTGNITNLAFVTANGTTINVTSAVVGTANVTTGNVNGLAFVTANGTTINVSSVLTGSLNVSGTANIGTLVLTSETVANLNVTTRANVVALDSFNVTLDPTRTYSIVNGNAVINNLTVQGNQTVVGSVINSQDTIQLRSNTGTDGDGHFDVYRGTTLNVNAQVVFNHTSNVWQSTANDAQSFVTLLTTANISDVVTSSSTSNAASANALQTTYNVATASYSQANTVSLKANAAYQLANQGFVVGTQALLNANLAYGQANAAYGQANSAYGQANSAYGQANSAYGQANLAYTTANSAANTVRVSQNSGSTFSQKQLNFINTANVTVVVSDGGDGNANIAISSSAGQPPGGSNQQVQFNDATNFSGSANIIYNKANGVMVVNNEVVVANLVFATGANAVQPTLVATRELLANAGVLNNPNTYTMNVSLSNNFDITLANTQTNGCNLTFASWALSGNLQTVTVILRQPGTNTALPSSNVATFTNTGIVWSNGEVPVLSVNKAKNDILTFVTVDGGVTVYGAHSMANIG